MHCVSDGVSKCVFSLTLILRNTHTATTVIADKVNTVMTAVARQSCQLRANGGISQVMGCEGRNLSEGSE